MFNKSCPKFMSCQRLAKETKCDGCSDAYIDFNAGKNVEPVLAATVPRKVSTWPPEGIEEYTVEIKDSGDRTQFASGAVRDMHENKGRVDLMPLEVVARVFGEDDIIEAIANYLSDGDSKHLYLALEAFAIEAFSNYETMVLETAVHFEQGAKKYGPDNWRKGIPTNCYVDSALRHYIKWLRGDTDERHDRAVCWNLMCCLWETDYHIHKEAN